MMTEPVASSALPLSPVTNGMGISDRKLESTHRAFCTIVSSPIEVLRSSPLRDLVPISRQMASMSGYRPSTDSMMVPLRPKNSESEPT